jgi:plasmid maintenance system antidote protein VapI
MTIEEFWARTEPEPMSGCLLWIGQRRNGYGRANVGNGIELAHRIAYRQAHGEIPPGLLVLHKCDNPPCINQAHLFAGSQRDNQRDKTAKNRHGAAKITTGQVVEIRRRAAIGDVSQRALAREFGISHREVGDIIRGRQWTVVPMGDPPKTETKFRSKLSAEDSIAIRRAYSLGATQYALADRYGVDQTRIGRIVRGLTRGVVAQRP